MAGKAAAAGRGGDAQLDGLETRFRAEIARLGADEAVADLADALGRQHRVVLVGIITGLMLRRAQETEEEQGRG